MKTIKLTGLAFTAALLPIVAAGAAEVISGRDAAYIDWAVRNCAVKSSAKEHGLIDQSKLINETAFTRDYMSAFQSKVLADAISTPQKTDTLCTEIKAWYGPIGSRIADLLVWAEAPPPDKPKAATATAKGDGGRRGHRGQQQ